MMTRMTTKKAIGLARRHRNEGTFSLSARLCLSDALDFFDNGDYPAATRRALKSLCFSVGILHADYLKVERYIIRKGWGDK